MKDLMPKIELLPGVEKLIRHLHKCKIPMGVATSSSAYNVEKKIINHEELFSKFSHVTTGSDPELKNGKPSPDIFLLSASRFGVLPEKCLVFEDSVNGIEAAKAAGMQSVMIPNVGLDPALTKNATLLLRSMECFRPEDFGLPPFDKD